MPTPAEQVIIDAKSLRVVTALKFAEDTLRSISAMTFLYDPNWSAQQKGFNGITLPFAFFETVKDETSQQNDVSSKRIILYEPGANDATSANDFRASVLNVVADNIVSKPLVHKLTCLVPFGFVTKLFSNVTDMMESVNSVFNSVGLAQSMSMRSTLDIIQAAVTSAGNFVSLATTFAPHNNAAYNMNSLLAMARNRSILKFKSWESWDYKYVCISNLIFEKVGTEDNYMRCTMELQEMQILSVGVKASLDVEGTAKEKLDGSTAVLFNLADVFRGKVL